MCCFSRPVEHVSATRIFARPLGRARQLLVYGMTVALPEDLAMVLPIPVPPGSPEGCVTFVDLSPCPTFLDDVAALFPAQVEMTRGFGLLAPQSRAAPKLVVHDVGDFEASFVPTPRDFDRLDERFRLPGEVWEALPRYADWGFCVFKLKSKKKGLLGFLKKDTGPSTIHPMAFEFPRRDPSSLFFPTVHVHDGTVQPTAGFDHELYCQVDASLEPFMQWQRSQSKTDLVAPRARPWVDAGRWVYKRGMRGELPNRDTLVVESKLRARAVVGDTFRLRMQAAWEHVVDDGKTALDPLVKKWIRIGEAERARVRDALARDLGALLDAQRAAFALAPYRHDLMTVHPDAYESLPNVIAPEVNDDGCLVAFSASNERIEPQQLEVAFTAIPSKDVRVAIQDAFQKSLNRATSS